VNRDIETIAILLHFLSMHLCLFFFLAKSLYVVFGCTLSTNKMILYLIFGRIEYNLHEISVDRGITVFVYYFVSLLLHYNCIMY